MTKQAKHPASPFLPLLALVAALCCLLVGASAAEAAAAPGHHGRAASERHRDRHADRANRKAAKVASISSTRSVRHHKSPAPTPEPTPTPTPTPEPTPAPAPEPTPTESPSTTPSTGPILWGAYMHGPKGDAPMAVQSLEEFTTNAGRKPTIVHYGRPWGEINPAYLETARQRGAVPMVDMGGPATPPLAEIAAGKADAALIKMANEFKSYGGPVLFRPFWEMNGNWYFWGREHTPTSTFIAAWRHMHEVMAPIAPNISWVWCPNVFFSTAGTDPAPWYPGNEYVDWVGFDGYNHGTNPLGYEGWHTPAQVYETTYNRLRQIAPSKPILVGETASTEMGGSKAAWIGELLSQLPTKFPAIRALVWFNWACEGWDWPIETSASAETAFKTGISSPYYGATPNASGKLAVP